MNAKDKALMGKMRKVGQEVKRVSKFKNVKNFEDVRKLKTQDRL